MNALPNNANYPELLPMKSSLLQFIAALVLLGLSACVPPVETFDPLPFDETEYNALPKTGTGTVKGQVFAKTRGGDVKKGAGNNVVLIPATAYGTQRYREQVIGGKLLSSPEDPRYRKYVLQQTTDGDGRFNFTNVPPGKYYAVSSVTWEVPIELGNTEIQGGKVFKEIEIQNGQTIEVMLTF